MWYGLKLFYSFAVPNAWDVDMLRVQKARSSTTSAAMRRGVSSMRLQKRRGPFMAKRNNICKSRYAIFPLTLMQKLNEDTTVWRSCKSFTILLFYITIQYNTTFTGSDSVNQESD